MPFGSVASAGYVLLWLLGNLLSDNGERAPTWYGVLAVSYTAFVLLMFG